MHDDQLKETLAKFNTAKEFAEDLIAFEKCKEMLKHYVRSQAISYIQTLINRYKTEIDQWGFLIDGGYVIFGVDYTALSDFQIIDQLIYIGQRIPIYAFIREGERKVISDLLNLVGRFGFYAYKQLDGDK